MKSGTHVHEKLEAEIYKTVTVDLETREDAWGLKLWNFLQGLRSLEEGGRTRELEVWGTVGGEVVNGVVDEVGWVCPDPDLEREMVSTAETTPGSKEGVMTSPSKRGKHSELPPGQQTLTDFFAQQQTGSSLNNALDKSVRRKRSRSPPTKTKKLYITDTKTRSSTTLPRGAAFRPTKIQLMLYHRLLSDMAAGEVDFQVIADRYGLETEAPFSDSFIAQVGGLEDEVFPSSLTSQTSHGPTDGVTTLLSHNNLSSLWTLLISRLQSLLPARRASIGPILTAEYRSRDTGEVIGSHSFVHDDKVLDLYVDREMEWWKGEREAEGVVVEEAYKCRSCEFADGCHWRNGRIKGAVERARRGWR
jgi:exonuclease V